MPRDSWIRDDPPHIPTTHKPGFEPMHPSCELAIAYLAVKPSTPPLIHSPKVSRTLCPACGVIVGEFRNNARTNELNRSTSTWIWSVRCSGQGSHPQEVLRKADGLPNAILGRCFRIQPRFVDVWYLDMCALWYLLEIAHARWKQFERECMLCPLSLDTSIQEAWSCYLENAAPSW